MGATHEDGHMSFPAEPRRARTEDEWVHSRQSNIQHGQKRPRPVSRSAILVASSVLVAALAVLVVEVWQVVAA
ncbi:hypothetical protein [Microbacterium sp. NPDC056052]|uniref:hypothetical protein n=1 Tax=Microbacterium sp. NPDC056052 TaxID=3345695 RepID=UPI0035E3B570